MTWSLWHDGLCIGSQLPGCPPAVGETLIHRALVSPPEPLTRFRVVDRTWSVSTHYSVDSRMHDPRGQVQRAECQVVVTRV